jgi:glycine/D-amino acid oxidase-like deaminating enzyme
MNTDFDVIIVGAGCAGLFSALELSNRHFRCLVLDTFPVAGFASTRNQGWLQSGALYAGGNQADVAEACRRGTEFLRAHFSAAVRDEYGGYFFFDTEAESHRFERLCATAKIDVQQVAPAVIEREEPIVRETSFRYAIRVTDRPFDTHFVLSEVAKRALDRGVEIKGTDKLKLIRLKRTSAHWRVALDGGVLSCRAVVLTGGAYISRFLKTLRSSVTSKLLTKRIAVLSLDRQISKSLLIGPLNKGAPNIVPYSIKGQVGVTICLNKNDVPTKNAHDFSVPGHEIDDFADALSSFFPRSREAMDGASAHFYSCQKVEETGQTDSRNHILVDHSKADPGILGGLFSFYPGKFTAAPIVARDCADAIETQWTTSRRAREGSGGTGVEVEVARQKFLERGSFTAKVQNGQLHFRRRR